MARQARFQIDRRALLLVEGRDEVNLFRRLIDSCINDVRYRDEIHVIDVGGKDQFKRRMSAISVKLNE